MKTSEKYSKSVETTKGNGKVARHQQYFISPVFLRDLNSRHIKNQGLFGKGLRDPPIHACLLVNKSTNQNELQSHLIFPLQLLNIFLKAKTLMVTSSFKI